jgi:microcystin-dependent protein
MSTPKIMYEGMEQNTKNAFVAFQKYTEDLELRLTQLNYLLAKKQASINVLEDELDASKALPGFINTYAGSSAPTGWLICNGSAISRSTYSDLYAVIGTTYGIGDGSTTFNIPDFRAASPAGAGTSTGYTANETLTLGTKYDDQAQGHWHTVGAKDNHDVIRRYVGAGGGNGGASGSSSSAQDYQAETMITNGSNGTPRVGSVTKGKQLAVNFIIKY